MSGLSQEDANQVLNTIQSAGTSVNEQYNPKMEALVSQAIAEDVLAAQQEGDNDNGDN